MSTPKKSKKAKKQSDEEESKIWVRALSLRRLRPALMLLARS